jgi:D-apionolactonase
MREFTRFETWYGRNVPPPLIHKLHAGKLSLEFEDGDLRYVRLGKRELIRRIYVAVRDVNWNTIPAQISGLTIENAEDHFLIEYDALHESPDIRFRWHARLQGGADGKIDFEMEGVAENEFRYCRIGFCVLHPIQQIAGQPYSAQSKEGVINGVLPVQVGPQTIINGFETPLFPSFSSLTIALEDGSRLSTQFEGDLFEMEDQRNWTDGSFKTYCTPISQGYPHQAHSGSVFHQKISIQVESVQEKVEPVNETAERIVLAAAEAGGSVLPEIGFGLSPEYAKLGQEQFGLLAALWPQHLRIELHLQNPVWPVSLASAQAMSLRLNSPMELVLFLGDQSADSLALLAQALRRTAIKRVLIFEEAEAAHKATRPEAVELVRSALRSVLPETQFVGGTNGNFAELNREPPDAKKMDGIAYTLNPQVHLFDERSLIEAIEAQRDTVLTARKICDSAPVHISAVSLKPPFNQAAREEEKPRAMDLLPPNVDPRQMSLIAAAWTVGSIRSLAVGGARSITYYDLYGWRGLMETLEGNRLPAKFLSEPGMIFPVYWVFRCLAGHSTAEIFPILSNSPLTADGLMLHNGNRWLVLVANYTCFAQEVFLLGIPDGYSTLRRLNEQTYSTSAWSAAEFWSSASLVPASTQGEMKLSLLPYETVMIDISASPRKDLP